MSEPEHFNSLMTRLDVPMTVVTAAVGEERGGVPGRLPLAVQHPARPLRGVALEGQPHLPGGLAVETPRGALP